jgi:hypothetical protein
VDLKLQVCMGVPDVWLWLWLEQRDTALTRVEKYCIENRTHV